MRVLGEGVAIEACIRRSIGDRAPAHELVVTRMLETPCLVPRVCGVSAPVSVRFRL